MEDENKGNIKTNDDIVQYTIDIDNEDFLKIYISKNSKTP